MTRRCVRMTGMNTPKFMDEFEDVKRKSMDSQSVPVSCLSGQKGDTAGLSDSFSAF